LLPVPGGQFAVRVVVHEGDHVHVEVADQGGPWDTKPAQRGGRWHGLDLVEEIASRWGRESGLGGSWVVWFRIGWPAPAPMTPAAPSDGQW
jgi:hypothetical protein